MIVVSFMGYAYRIPKNHSKIWISTINKDFCGLLMAFKLLSS